MYAISQHIFQTVVREKNFFQLLFNIDTDETFESWFKNNKNFFSLNNLNLEDTNLSIKDPDKDKLLAYF